MHLRRTLGILIIATSILLAATVAARAGSRAPDTAPDLDGHWAVLGAQDHDVPFAVLDLAWHGGRLLATGSFRPGYRSYPRDHVAATIQVWQDTCWVPLAGAPEGQASRLCTDGERLAVVVGKKVHLLTDGAWSALPPVGDGSISALAFWKGAPVIGGSFSLAGRDSRVYVAVWDGVAWQPVGGDVGGGPAPWVKALLPDGDLLWVAGRFERAGKQMAQGVAAWDGLVWRTLRGGVEGEVVALAAHDGAVAVTGLFTRAGDRPCDGLALWRDGAWQPLPLPPEERKESFRTEACPLPRIDALVSWSGRLVAAGPFSFGDPSGHRARSVAWWDGAQWRALAGSDRWFEPGAAARSPRYDPPDTVVTIADIPYYEAWARERIWWHPRTMLVVEPRLVLAADRDRDHEAVVFVVEGGSKRRLDPRRRRVGEEVTVHDTPAGVVVAGRQFLGNVRVEGLGRLEGDRWQPLADWLEPAGLGGGKVHAVTTWRGDLVVAGEIDTVGGEFVRHVARLRDGHWQALGRGIPYPTLHAPVLAPVGDGLVLVGAAGPSTLGANGTTSWRFDGREWSLIRMPAETSPSRERWSLAAGPDTLWAVAALVEPPTEERRWAQERGQGLFCLTDSTWAEIHRWVEPRVQPVVHWRGEVYGLAYRWQADVRRLVRWRGGDWREVDARNLPVAAKQVLVAGDRLLIVGDDVSLAWTCAGWEVWPGRERQPLFWAGQRLYASGRELAEWTGVLPPPDPAPLPPAPAARTWYPSRRIHRDDLPALVDFVAADTTWGWTVHHSSGFEAPPRVEPAGDRGLRVEISGKESYTSVSYRFAPEPETWYRFSCRLHGKTGEELSFKIIDVDSTRDRRKRREMGQTIFLRDADDHVEILAASPATARTGYFCLRLDHGEMKLTDLEVRTDPFALEVELSSMWREIRERWRPLPGRGGALPPELPGDLWAAARRVHDPAGADSLLADMVARFGDPRMQVDRTDSWGNETSGWPEPRATLFSVPTDSLPCDILPAGIERWLVGDVGYCRPGRGRRSVDPRSGWTPLAAFTGQGLIVDLRWEDDGLLHGADHRWREEHPGQTFDIPNPHALLAWLERLGYPEKRWARQRTASGRRSTWYEVEDPGKGPDCPIAVLVSSATGGGSALLAEALSRWGRVTVIGETTGPLPAVEEWVLVPWLRRKRARFPAGWWQAPDGGELTGTRVEPDVPWPATDTEGLVERAREVIAAQRALTAIPR